MIASLAHELVLTGKRYKFHDLETAPLVTLTDRWVKRDRTESP